MNDSKKKYAMLSMLMSAAMLASFLVLVAALKGDSVLRIVLAAVGFVGFCGLYVALLVANKRAASSTAKT